MAREKKNKEPGRLAQMWQVFQMTRRLDKSITWILLLCLVLPVAVAVVAGILLSSGNGFVIAIWVAIGLLLGILLGLIVLGRRAEKAALSQIMGQPGAVGAVIKNVVRRGWITNEMPVAVNPKTQDAIYRIVGRGGVVLIAEGPISRTQRLSDDERRKINKLVPNVPVTVITVGPDPQSVALDKINWRLNRVAKTLTKNEVSVVNSRLQSMGGLNIPIPKGMDPRKVRAGRPR